jgi:hypothetical protein
MILGVCMPLPDVSHKAIAVFPPFHRQAMMEVGHALKEKPEAPVPERGFGRFNNLQMLTANVTEQNPPSLLRIEALLDVPTEDL